MIAELQRQFTEIAGRPGTVFFAPGRINLIGEHTDYSGGFVLPASIGLGTWVAVSPRQDRQVRVRSAAQNESISFSLDEIVRTEPFHWSNYLKGVAWALRQYGYPPAGADLLIENNVPLGSGLSSSASLEVAVASALLSLAGQTMASMRLAQLCQSAENDFVGARCGIMDQFAATHGLHGHALLLNCSTLEWRPVRLSADHRWVVANTMVRHSLASGEYNTRRAEVETLQEALRVALPHRRHLHELSDEDTEQLAARVAAKLACRLRHIVSENRRVQEFVSSLQHHDMSTAGRLLTASHRSLRDDFAVSCRELDVMVDLALQSPGVLGARMLGGGFGGCVLAWVQAEQVESFAADLKRGYRQATGIDPWMHVCDIEPGARQVA